MREEEKKRKEKIWKKFTIFLFSNIDKQLFNELSFSLSRILNVNAYYFISINKIMNMSKLEMACIY